MRGREPLCTKVRWRVARSRIMMRPPDSHHTTRSWLMSGIHSNVLRCETMNGAPSGTLRPLMSPSPDVYTAVWTISEPMVRRSIPTVLSTLLVAIL
jgi:hypothetical protein